MSNFEAVVQPDVFASGHRRKIGKPIVILNTVDVVNDMAFRDRPIRFFPDHAVHDLLAPQVVLSPVSPGVEIAVSTEVLLPHFIAGFQGVMVARKGSPALLYLPPCGCPKFLSHLWGMFVAKGVSVAQGRLTHFLSCFRRVWVAPMRMWFPQMRLAQFFSSLWAACVNFARHLTLNPTIIGGAKP